VERLQPDYDVTLLWYNPNLYPSEEHERRLAAARQVAEHFEVPIIEIPFDPWAWQQAVSVVAGWRTEKEGGARCKLCLAMRVARTAREAAQRGFECFDTSLSVSPHKDADFIKRMLWSAAGDNPPAETEAVNFRKRGGFARSVELSKEMGLYRQDYCGCRYSRRRDLVP
jgi:predicted adenine nucleotide alpha hydrolase (AANH) superfamily ATPase